MTESEILIKYYGSDDIIISSDNIFKFTLNSDKTTANISLSDSINQSLPTEIVIPYICEIEGNSYVITKIDDNAFSSYSNLKDVILPNTITSIGNYAFHNRTSLTSITIPNSVTSIGEAAFYGCVLLNAVYYKGTKEEWDSIQIGNDNSDVLGCVKIYCYDGTCGDNLTYIYNGVDTLTINGTGDMYDYVDNKVPWISCGLKNIENIVIIEGVTSIGNGAFSSCTNLISILIPNSVEYIGKWAFVYCKSLKNVIIGENVTEIGSYAFQECESLTSIEIPNGVESIKEYTFNNCYNLESVMIPYSIETIEDYAFSGCKNLNTVYYEGKKSKYISIGLWGNEYLRNAPNIIYCSGKCGNNLIYSLNDVDDVLTIDGIGNMYDYAEKEAPWDKYGYSISIKTVSINEGVTSIGTYAFFNCVSLRSIDVNEYNESYCSIDGVLFNKNLTTLILYPMNKRDKKYIIPNSVTQIYSYAFVGNNNLTGIIISDNVISMGSYTFKNCRNLSQVKIGNEIKEIGEEVFYGCRSLEVIAIPENVDEIKNQCFSNCIKLKKVIVESENLIVQNELETFPVKNEDFKIYANPQGSFKNNVKLSSYIAIWEKYDGIYYYCNGVEDRVLFYDYNSIGKTVVLFNSLLRNDGVLKQIDYNAFIGCDKIKMLEINEDVVVKTNTFTTCENLINVFINSKNVQIEKNGFPLNNFGFTIYSSINSLIVKNRELQPYIYLFKENKSVHNSHLFIAGVGEVELFKGNDIVLTSKTLIDTGINLTVNLDDIQGNGGAKLYGKYASQAGMTVKLTEAMFKMEFLAANLGEVVEIGGSAVVTEMSVVQDGIIKIDGEPLPLYIGSQDKVVWVGKQGESSNFISFSKDKIQKGEGDNFGKIFIKDVPFPNNTQVCVKYIKEYDEGQTIKVSSNYLPDEMTAILTASLFAGDQNSLESATKVGTLTITIPRLMLSGNSDISMNMTGSSQMNIEGQALAVEESECDEGGYYAIISKVLKNTTWTSNLAGLAIDNANHLKKDDLLQVYGVFYGMGTRPLTKEQYVVLPSNCVDKTGRITYNESEDLLITVILTDDSSKITRGIIEANQE